MGLGGTVPEYGPAARSLNERIQSCLAQRCTEPHLTAADIAASVQISVRTLHRNYAAANTTFGERLIEARMRTALRRAAAHSHHFR
jgi:transcriptional regulator GlxA family with amidase domain